MNIRSQNNSKLKGAVPLLALSHLTNEEHLAVLLSDLYLAAALVNMPKFLDRV